ncbi:MAG: mechanosensitive ion channel [Candidatus Scalindua sp.]|nr:mechanosensitive ion channel [Candidatus Scalindua sp.]
MSIRKAISIIILISVYFGLTIGDLCGQPTDVKEILQQATPLEDIKKTLASNGQDIINIELNLKVLKEELETLHAAREKLIEDKVEDLDSGRNQKIVVEERINTLNETIGVRSDIKDVASNLAKDLDIMSTLTERKNRISDEASLLPASQFESIQNELELLKARLEATTSSVKEKGTYLSSLQASLEASRLKLEEERKKLKDKIRKLTIRKPSTQEESNKIEAMKRSLESEIKLKDEKVNLLLNQTELARLNLQTAQIQEVNIQSEIDINTQIVAILSQRFKEEEATRKRAEEEKARKAEEERRRVAEEEKARAEMEKMIALKKAEVAVQKQLEATSPEKKRVLEVEADVHKQEGIIATIKDELINEDTVRYKDREELKRIQNDVEKMLGGENTSGEIDEELKTIENLSNRILHKIDIIQGFLAAVEKQRSIIGESIASVRASLSPATPGEKSSIEKEAESFTDRTQAEQLVKLENMRLRLMEEQEKLIQTKKERLNERLEINNALSGKLLLAKKELSEIRAANVWARRENTISIHTFRSILSDIRSLKNKPVDFYNASIQNGKKLSHFLLETKNTPQFVTKLFIIIAVILLSYFGRRYLKKWAREKKQSYITVTPQTFYTFKLIPGLLKIMHGTLTVFFLFVITFSISVTVPSQAPLLLSTMYGFAVYSVYKILKGFVSESFSPYSGTRWTTIPYFSSKLLFRDLNILLLFSAVSVTLLSALYAHQYGKKDVIELVWFQYRIGSLFLIILIAAKQRSYLLRLLPYPESALGKIINKSSNLLYPLLIGFVISLFALRSLGFVLLTYTLIGALIKTISVVVIIYIAHEYLIKLLLHSQKNRLKECRLLEAKEMAIEERGINVRFRVYQKLLHYGTAILSVVMVLGILNETFKDVVNSPAAPTVFLEVYQSILFVLGSIKSSLTHKFPLAEGRYTTPFKMLFGILVLVLAFILARYLRKILQKRFEEKALIEKGAQQAISSGVRYFIIGIAAIIGLNVAGIPLRSLTIFAGAFGIGIGFGMQNIINNFVSGLILFAERPIKIGDIVEVDKLYGVVEHIGARSTRVRSSQNTHIIVPNSSFLQNNVLNWTLSDNLIRASIKVGVIYGSPTREVERLLYKVVREHEKILKIPEPDLLFNDFGENSLDFEMHFWIKVTRMFDRRRIESDLRYKIDSLFRDAGIVIAFPQRDIHFNCNKPIEVRVVGDRKVEEKSFTDIDSANREIP